VTIQDCHGKTAGEKGKNEAPWRAVDERADLVTADSMAIQATVKASRRALRTRAAGRADQLGHRPSG